MEQKILNLQLFNNRGISFMDEQVFKGHQAAINGVFGRASKPRRQDTPIITQQSVELYQSQFNNDVEAELTEVGQLLFVLEGVISKHKKHNYQDKLQQILNEMSDVISSAAADYRTLISDAGDNLDDRGWMTINELEEQQQCGDPDLAYDNLREGV